MLLGLHGPNADWTTLDYGVVYDSVRKEPRFDAAKLLHWQGTQHTERDILSLRSLGVQRFTMRLWDSTEFVRSLPDGSDDPEGYARKCIETVRRFWPLGIRDYQIDCEPNITWAALGREPANYQAFLQRVIHYLLEEPGMPPGVRYGFPPMSFATRHRPYDWLGALIDQAPLFQFLCANSYWQSDRQGRLNILAGPMTWSMFGGNVEWYMEWQPGMPVQITEWGNSIHEQGVYPPVQIEAFRREQYPLYLEWLSRHTTVEAAYCWIAPGATDEWSASRISPALASVMAQAMAALRAQDVSRRVGGRNDQD